MIAAPALSPPAAALLPLQPQRTAAPLRPCESRRTRASLALAVVSGALASRLHKQLPLRTCSRSCSRSFSTARKAEAATKPPRVRFAPSPTGVLHVGGARTALFNWLFAKSQGGEMVLRIEDTDVARSTEESEVAILDGLKWCGLTWDEGPDKPGDHGPYRQSERIKAGIYQEQLEKLIAAGKVYRCFLTAKELDDMRAEAERNDQAFVIDSPWARASQEEVQKMLDEEKPFVYRFRVPPNEEIIIDDLVLGEVIWNSDDLGGDFVIVRQNGMPMYNFGVVVDDAMMDITHVLRAQEHLMNTPRQVLIYEALGIKEPPKFGHMPLILAPDRSKLSKRHGAVSVGEYRRQGYLSSGLVNYLSQLGWNDGTNKEIYDTESLLESFKMERMSKVAAIFDREKFKWVNGHHIRLLKDEEAQKSIGKELEGARLVKSADCKFAQGASLLLRDRIAVLADAPKELEAMLEYHVCPTGFTECDVARPFLEDGSLLQTARALVSAESEGLLAGIGQDPEALKALVKYVKERRTAELPEGGKITKKGLLAPLRVCLTGTDHGPDMTKLFKLLREADSDVLLEIVQLSSRLDLLRQFIAHSEEEAGEQDASS